MNYNTWLKNLLAVVLVLCLAVMAPAAAHAAPAEGATVQYSGTSGTVTWEIYTDGTMVIRPTSGDEGTMNSLSGSAGGTPWYNMRSSIKKVETQGIVHLGSNAAYMFYDLTGCAEMDLSGLDTENVTNMNGMFSNCTNLVSLDVGGFNTSNVTNMGSMFSSCSKITSLDVNSFDTGNVTNMSYMFQNCRGLTSLDVSEFDTDNVTNMGSMFYGCSGLTFLDVSDFDTSKVAIIESMFSGCSKLTSIDVSGFDTSHTVHISRMFKGCSSLTSLDVSGFDTGKATNMTEMFYDCSNLTTLNVSGLDTDSVTNMQSMFYNCSKITTLDVSGFNTANVTNMSSMFKGCSGLTSLDVSGFDTGKVTTMYSMFSECSGLTSLNIGELDTNNVTNMNSMFYRCSSLTSLDISGLDTDSVTDMNAMFSGCSGLVSLDVSGFNTANVTKMGSMFFNCQNLTSLDFSGFDTGKVTTMGGMFQNCSKLISLNVSVLDTRNVTDMNYMFGGCSGLTSLDVSGFDTGSVTNMSYMFSGCSGLTSLDLSGLDTSKVTNINRMFDGCSGLTSLDISGFDTGMANSMHDIFRSCDNLSEIILGEKFRFKGKNIFTPANQALLPYPPSATTTVKWVREDGSVEAKTPDELRDQYDANAAAWAGKWVWEVKSDTAIVTFDAQGGYTPQGQITVSPIEPITIPDASRPGYILTGWNTAADGSGTSYQPGSTFTPAGGKMTTLYAQWEQAAQYEVRHLQQNAQMSGYDLVETESFYGPKNGQVTPAVKTYENFRSPEAQTVTVAEDDSTVVEYRYDRMTYTIHFDGNGADSGEMPDQQMVVGVTKRLTDNRYKKMGAVFNGWNTSADGSGTRYGDAQTAVDLAGDGETFTLYAQWIDLGADAGHESSSGRYTVKIRPGQDVVIPNLPAGTRYRVREVENPDGWSQSGIAGEDGVITPNGESSTDITNTYSASGVVSLVAHKAMTNREPKAGEFTFELLQGEDVLQTVQNGIIDNEEEILGSDGETTVRNPFFGLSVIRFDDIVITEEGTYTYTIREVKGGAEDVRYDEHEETVTVTAADNGDGTLTCTAAYDDDGAVFTNEVIPRFDEPDKTGRLLISKEVPNLTSSQQTFPFTVRLYDSAGTELSDTYKAEVVRTGNEDDYITEGTENWSAVSHTENLDDLGNQNSDFGSNWGNANIRGTGREEASGEAHVVRIPGAEELDVTIVYGGTADAFAAVWQGAHPEYTAESDYASAAYRLGGGDHTAVSNTRTFTIPGDAVTFGYHSGGSEDHGDGYGYYAVIAGQVPSEEFSDKCLSHSEITSGGTIDLASGETAVIRGLPAGVTYRVEEGEVAGFELTGSEGAEGTLVKDGDSVADARASFTNVYNGQGEAQIHLRKVYEDGELHEGEFSFTLFDGDGNEIETVTNGADGSIVFSPIQYTTDDIGQRYSYSVVENRDEEKADVLYDEHTENVIIAVSDGGDGNLIADVQYMGEGVFVNRPGLSTLSVSKTVRGNFGSKARKFSFTVTLTDANDVPLGGTYACTGAEADALTLNENGSASFELGHGDTMTIEGVPIGTKYSVSEADYTGENYTTESENDTGVITVDGQAVSFTNTAEGDVPTGAGGLTLAGAVISVVAALCIVFIVWRRKKRV